MRVRLKGINTVKRYRVDGSFVVYRYHRATGRLLEGEPGSPAFLASYSAAEKSRAVPTPDNCLETLIRLFEDSHEFAAFGDVTKNEYRRKLKIVSRKWGGVPIPGLIENGFKKDAIEWRDGLAANGALRSADSLFGALTRVLSHAVAKTMLERNILLGVVRLYHSDRADKIWLPEHIAAFTAAAPVEMVQALMLAMHTGQRQGDLRRLPWSAYDGQRITLIQGKKRGKQGRASVSIRCTVALKRMLDGMTKRGPLILTTARGGAWKKRWFAENWQAASEKAKITDLHFHDLRGTAVTMLAEAGCTVPEIAAVTGHTLTHAQRILDLYLARTRTLADAAIFKLEKRARALEKKQAAANGERTGLQTLLQTGGRSKRTATPIGLK